MLIKNIFSKVWQSVYCFFSAIAVNFWWPVWSNLRFKNAERSDILVTDEDTVYSIGEIKMLICRIYKKFNYTADDASQLWDAITPPPQNYKNYLAGKVSDDCDGFHSTVYHCLHRSGIPCFLLSVIAPKASHCLLAFKFKGKWYILDYTQVYDGYFRLADAIKAYNKVFVKKYNSKYNVLYNGLTEFNYNTGKFKSQSIKRIN